MAECGREAASSEKRRIEKYGEEEEDESRARKKKEREKNKKEKKKNIVVNFFKGTIAYIPLKSFRFSDLPLLEG